MYICLAEMKIPIFMSKETALELIFAEREEQIRKHGWTAEHDDDVNCDGQLAMAAEAAIDGVDGEFPANWDLRYIQKICDKPKKQRLIISGALFMAERDRVERRIHEIEKEIEELQKLVL